MATITLELLDRQLIVSGKFIGFLQCKECMAVLQTLNLDKNYKSCGGAQFKLEMIPGRRSFKTEATSQQVK